MLKPVDTSWVFEFVGKDIDPDNDLPTTGIGTGSKAYDVKNNKTYIFFEEDNSWTEVTLWCAR